MPAIATGGSSPRTGLLIGLGVFALVAILSALGRLQPSNDALLALVAAPLSPGLATESLIPAPAWAQYATTLAFALLVGWLAGRGGPLTGLLTTLGALALVFGLLLAGSYLPLMAPVLAVMLTGGLLVANGASYADRQRAEATTRMQSRLQAISGIGRLANSSLERDQLLVEILQWAQNEIDAEGSSLMLKLRVEVAPDMPVFRADRDKLEAVLINLVENAVKYSPGGGSVTVRVGAEGEQVVIEVQDQGVGIREEDLPRLFRSFQRLHDSTWGQVSGTGVGLYICKHILEAHGGAITVDSVWGEGSTFRLQLPLLAAPPPRPGPCPRGPQ